MYLSPAPSPPSGVSVSQNGLNSLLVSWTSGEPGGSGYNISYQTLERGYSGSVTNETATSTIITELMTGATYCITIVATSNTLNSTETTAPDITIGTGSNSTCRVSILLSHYHNVGRRYIGMARMSASRNTFSKPPNSQTKEL